MILDIARLLLFPALMAFAAASDLFTMTISNRVSLAKVAAGAALWFGFGHLMNYLVYASLFGGVLTLFLLQFRQWPLPYALAGQTWLLRLHAKESGLPYGIALAIGALMIYPETEWIKAVDLTHLMIG